MEYIKLNKGLVIGIICLFFGASGVPSLCGELIKSNTATNTTIATSIVSEPLLEIGMISGGFGLKVQIKNTGTINATNVSVNMTFYGAWMILPLLENYQVTLDNLGVGVSKNVSVIVFGLGTTNVKIDATCAEEASATKIVTGKVFLFFMLGIK